MSGLVRLVVEKQTIEIIIRMAIDTPAKIAIIGAGPIGLEAALYARFLGYETEVFERGEVADRYRNSIDPMSTKFDENSTALALAAMEAQGGYESPEADATLTGAAFSDDYLVPLSRTDLLRGEIRTGCEVIGIERVDDEQTFDPFADVPNNGSDDTDDCELESPAFAVYFRESDGSEGSVPAHVVIDASGRQDTSESVDLSFLRTLNISHCERTGTFLGSASQFDAARDQFTTPACIMTSVPNFYVLGSKSFGWGFDFSLRDGHEQIRSLFSILGDRADLDLYRSIRPLGG